MENVIVRPARKEDADAVARLFMMAWPMDSFLAMSPELDEDKFAEIISSYVQAEDTLYSYRNTMVAEVGNVIAGAMNGYDGASYDTLKRPILEDFAKRFPDAESDFGAVKETEAGEFYLDSAGVRPDMRSMGIGSKLFEAMIGRAKEAGFRTVGLIVDVDKPKAEALYLRLGFSFIGYKEFLGQQMKHMQKDIG
ncbi:MAG: GNAT family N-acetyltransferase [Bacteroidetes bacterium]|uniref:GNAT family N-acetyltransferase n=1 Tax=Candidatus Cryptobacteroides merdavium TaxID=2840769 RepID=A0A9D9EE22_9BACT|nr:GNAT family N-acetyltransferase [Candidatus Cryptobacteroides merdavium]